MIALPPVESKGFSLSMDTSGSRPTVKFNGNGDTEAIAPLNRFLKLLHKSVLEGKVAEVAVDLGQLYFMNSSCLKAFVSWIYQVKTGGDLYRIRLLMNPRLHWQRRSLERLARLAPKVVTLDELPSMPPRAASGT